MEERKFRTLVVRGAKDRNYRKIEAMYRKGYGIKQIVRSCPDMCEFEVIDVIQKIFALDMIRAELKGCEV